MPAGEREFVRLLARLFPAGGLVALGVGDDAAVLELGGESWVWTTDQLLGGVHFEPGKCSWAAAGGKSLNRSLSDVAAMGCRPRAALFTFALPRALRPEARAELLAGVAAAAAPWQVAVAGGDSALWDGPPVLTCAVLGSVPAGRRPLRRAGGRPGERLLVTGALGGSLLGRHLDFTPRVAEGLALNEGYPVGAMIDLSDGLALDLARLAEASGGLGAVVEEAALPVAPAAREAARASGRPALEHVLGDGEDYELLFSLPPADARRLAAAGLPGGTPVAEIGELTAAPGLFLERAGGGREPLPALGFDHFAAGD